MDKTASDLLLDVAATLEQAAGTLRETARCWREPQAGEGAPADSGESPLLDSSPTGGPPERRGRLSKRDLAQVAKKIAGRWSAVSFGSILTVGSQEIDLATVDGKWQLLILAVLRGARVRETVVEETFEALVKNGLTGIERLASGTAEVRAGLAGVFAAKYRALGHRAAKVDALVANAALLLEEYGGDLDRLYAQSMGDASALIHKLQRFRQVGLTAHWFCRVLKIHGIWPGVSAEATRYFDQYTDLPLERLGLVEPGETSKPMRLTARFVDAYLDGDTTPLYLHGLHLCSQNRASVCVAQCPLSEWCPYVKRPNETQHWVESVRNRV